MTNITTAERERRRLRAIAWGIAIGFHVVLLVAMLTITPLRHTVLQMSTEEIRQVADRERASAERQRLREKQQQRQPVPEEYREDLKEELEQRNRDELTQAVKELRDIRNQMEEQQREVFEELREFEVERSPRDLEELYEGIYQNVRRARISDEKENLKELSLETRRQVGQAREEVEALETDVRNDAQRKRTAEASRKVAESAEKLAEELLKDAEESRKAATELANAVEEAEEKAEQDTERRPDEAIEALAERAERLTRRAKVNKAVAENIQRRVEKLKEAADHVEQTAEEAAAKAVPPEAVNPPEAGTPADDATLDRLAADDLYKTAQKLENEIDRRYRDTRSAQRSMQDRTSFEEARAIADAIPKPERPDLAAAIAQAGLKTLGEVGEFRSTLREAVNQTQLMQSHARQQLAQVDPATAEPLGANVQSAAALAAATPTDPGGMSSANTTSNSGGSALSASIGNDGRDEESDLAPEMAAAKALPGRRFTDSAAREGWLYVDTWYIIGPWDLSTYRTKPLPPEFEINLDATYNNGKSGRTHHPRLRKYFELDGEVKWQFVQSESIYIRPPDETRESIYYAYTEVFSDREREILFAIDIDDRSTLWVNDEAVWSGTVKAWRLGQTTRKVTLRPGFNKILIRMENDAPLMSFSLVLLASD